MDIFSRISISCGGACTAVALELAAGPLWAAGMTRNPRCRRAPQGRASVMVSKSAFLCRKPLGTLQGPPGTARRTAPRLAEGREPLGTPHDGWKAPPRGLDTTCRPGRGAGEAKLPILDAPHSCRWRSHHMVAARQESSRAEGVTPKPGRRVGQAQAPARRGPQCARGARRHGPAGAPDSGLS